MIALPPKDGVIAEIDGSAESPRVKSQTVPRFGTLRQEEVVSKSEVMMRKRPGMQSPVHRNIGRVFENGSVRHPRPP